jgi:uncharacterized phiE125 gp8 family phage protein
MSFRVITPPAAEPITLEEAKMHLRVVEPDEDALISTFIAAARGMLEQRTNRRLMAQTIEFALPTWGGFVIPTAPLVALGEISYVDATGTPQVLEDTLLYVDTYHEPAAAVLSMGQSWPALQPGNRPTVRAVVGYASADEVPAELKAWMLLAIAALYDNRASIVAGVSVTALPEDFMHWLWHPYMVYL